MVLPYSLKINILIFPIKIITFLRENIKINLLKLRTLKFEISRKNREIVLIMSHHF